MKIFEGKSPEERNKIIAAIVLGVLAVLALTYTFSGLFFPSRKNNVTVNVSPTPTPAIRNASQNPNLPSQQDMDFAYTTTPVVYNPGNFNAPDAGRNIFAFVEPGKPTPYSPTPTPPPTPFPTPPPTPEPHFFVAYATPQSVYAGSKGFPLQISGDRFTPDAVILFNGSQLPTTYLSPQSLSTQISDGLIAFPGTRNITVIAPDGKFSNMITLNVQEPPTPQFKYIGMIARKLSNNDMAYFEESGKEKPFGARLNDVVANRFRLRSISAEEVIFEDVSLGFRHKLALTRPSVEQSASSSGFPTPRGGGTIPVYNPPVTVQQPTPCIPGIPCNIREYNPTPRPTPPDSDLDVDDDGNEKKP